MKKIAINLRMFLWMTMLTGIIYPLFITIIAQFFMNDKADGSLITFKEAIIGSELIGQKFESDQYFWGRPSSVDYNPLPSGASNLGPTSVVLKNTVEERKKKIIDHHKLTVKNNIPAELLFASGSGLDPHIMLPTAYFQLDRIAKARGVDKNQIKKLVDKLKIKKPLGLLGEECVNVLMLNKELDEQVQK
jgi:K+-transporting ATPase ATPase C chain